MEFGFWDTVFLIALTIFFLYRDFKRRFHSKENEIDRVLAEAEKVRYKSVDSMLREVMFCKSEIVDGQIFVYEIFKHAFNVRLLCDEYICLFFIDENLSFNDFTLAKHNFSYHTVHTFISNLFCFSQHFIYFIFF